MSQGPLDITGLLHEVERGTPRSADELLALVYDQLRGIAQRRMGDEHAGHTLQATALVHEAYLKLCGGRRVPWACRAHFYAAAAEAMRQILVDHARRRGRAKRGGGARRDLDLDALAADSAGEMLDWIALDEAIRRLRGVDERMAQIVDLRFFAGLTVEETARAMDLSERTVKGDWAFARAWLAREMGGGP